MDFMAVISGGAYPTSTRTALERAILGVSYGLLLVAPEPDVPSSWTSLLGRWLPLNLGIFTIK